MGEFYKEYMICRPSGEVVESFSTRQAAAEFIEMMAKRNEHFVMKTNVDMTIEDEPDNQLIIEGLEIEEPDEERYGSDLDDMFGEEEPPTFEDL